MYILYTAVAKIPKKQAFGSKPLSSCEYITDMYEIIFSLITIIIMSSIIAYVKSRNRFICSKDLCNVKCLPDKPNNRLRLTTDWWNPIRVPSGPVKCNGQR